MTMKKSHLEMMMNVEGLPRCLTSFLHGNDTLRLFCTSQTMRQSLQSDERVIFRRHLMGDFTEGERLIEAVERRHKALGKDTKVPTKMLYLGFMHRWKVPKKTKNDDGVSSTTPNVAIPWQKPHRHNDDVTGAVLEFLHDGDEKTEKGKKKKNEVDDVHSRAEEKEKKDKEKMKKRHDDADSLFFIFRLWDVPDSCGILEWQCGGNNTRHPSDKLVIDEEWRDDFYETPGVLESPRVDGELYRLCTSGEHGAAEMNREDRRIDMRSIFRRYESTYRLTVHVLDIEKCQVLTLTEDSTGNIGKWNALDADLLNHIDVNLFGLPHKSSPYYQDLGDDDFNQMTQLDFVDYPAVETLRFGNNLSLSYVRRNSDDSLQMAVETLDISPCHDFSSIRKKSDICSFIRSMMKLKCSSFSSSAGSAAEPTTDELVDSQQVQPAFIRAKKILDSIISFLPFEEKAGSLRLVCKPFKEAAMRSISQYVLDKALLPIAFQRYGGCSWFRGDARRGWSSEMVDQESTIEQSLLHLFCKCGESCETKENCPNCKKGKATFRVIRKTQTLDMDEVRRKLVESGQIEISQDYGTDEENPFKRRHISEIDLLAEASFRRTGNKSLFQLCETICSLVKEETMYYTLLPSLAEHYGVSIEISSIRFLRSLFLVFADGASIAEGHFPEVSTASSYVKYNTEYDVTRVSMKKIFRFKTASYEKIELVFASRHSID